MTDTTSEDAMSILTNIISALDGTLDRIKIDRDALHAQLVERGNDLADAKTSAARLQQAMSDQGVTIARVTAQRDAALAERDDRIACVQQLTKERDEARNAVEKLTAERDAALGKARDAQVALTDAKTELDALAKKAAALVGEKAGQPDRGRSK